MSTRPTAGKSTRRTFLETSSAAALTAAMAEVSPAGTFHGGGRNEIRVGLVGCGGRGGGAAVNALRADGDTRLVALGDAFADHLERKHNDLKQTNVGERVDVPPERRFVGFDAYKGVIDACDVVLLATSPYFRPLHVEYAVQQGKHVFCEKPVATDGPGLRRIIAACKEAEEKGLNIVSGLCYRYQFAKQETVKRIHEGAIGDIVTMQTTYNTGGLWYREPGPDWTPMEVQMRNWLYYVWLSGDHIAEQHIHSLDKIAWAKGSYPAKCTASGGRIVRTDPKWGNVYDHFNTVYEWADGTRGFSSCRQWVGADSNVSDHIFGTKGRAELQSHRIESEGGWRWRYRGEGPDDMYQNEHNALFAAYKAGNAIQNGEYMCNSTLMALMGRMSAYTGKTISWEQALNSKEDLSPDASEWGAAPNRPVAKPGITQFV